ncbi:MAG: hypothetical protein PVF85_11600 [Anaerolineales bacterium]
MPEEMKGVEEMLSKQWIKVLLVILLAAQLACATFGTQGVVEEVASTAPPPTEPVNRPESSAPLQDAPEPAPQQGRFDPQVFSEVLDNYVLRPADLPDEYRIPPGAEQRVSNLGIIQNWGEVRGKRYLVTTGRVEGWWLELERKNKEDIAPYTFQSSIELFESSEGAKLALSPEWFKAYAEDAPEPAWLEGCDLGDECVFYFYEQLDPTTELTNLRYEVAFAYKNTLVWVMGYGLDIDVTPEYVMNAAEAMYTKLESAFMASR